ncbi:hypothetical protein LCGC14_1235470 [marine sediment metagenome]|uniref:Uncharacterized protein n=1 Tax=marine sediment metagenome TaxID=412755 RepID=A0A0F9LBJ7_9ZZZZ
MENQTTALVRVQPEIDPQVVAFHEQAVGLLEYAERRVIATIEDLKPATEDLAAIANIKKALEGLRVEYVKPLQDHVKAINETFRQLMEPILAADMITRAKVLAFQAKIEILKQAQEKVNHLREEAAVLDATIHGGELSEPTELIPVQAAVPTRTVTDMGTAGQRKLWKWEVVDFALLPDDFKVPNPGLLTAAVRGGKREIPGVEIYEEAVLTVRAGR